jgi:hemerythrin
LAYIKWSSDLDTGISVIDGQHRKIVDYINMLSAAKENGDKVVVVEVLDQLVDYTLSHFAFEEGLMEQAGYQYLKAHKRVHLIFTRKISEYQSRMASGENVIDQVLATLKRWLVNHIKNDDADYVFAVRGMTPGNRDDAQDNRDDKRRNWFSKRLRRLFGSPPSA